MYSALGDPSLAAGVGLDNLQRSLPTSTTMSSFMILIDSQKVQVYVEGDHILVAFSLVLIPSVLWGIFLAFGIFPSSSNIHQSLGEKIILCCNITAAVPALSQRYRISFTSLRFHILIMLCFIIRNDLFIKSRIEEVDYFEPL